MQINKRDSQQYPIVLTIAGSDSGGAAGIQADIKTISATGGYACSALTALTAQNTLGVDEVLEITPNFVEAQLNSVFADLDVRAVKVGMLGNAGIIETVAKSLIKQRPKHIVLDPVMVATSGDLLLDLKAVDSLIFHLIPLADVITPNIHEALVLLGFSHSDFPCDQKALQELAQKLLVLGSRNVLLKGGHLSSEDSTDILCSDTQQILFNSSRIASKNTHGSGCTLSSALASYLAQGKPLYDAVQLAKNYVWQAINASSELAVGCGPGPLHHFYNNRVEEIHTVNTCFTKSLSVDSVTRKAVKEV